VAIDTNRRYAPRRFVFCFKSRRCPRRRGRAAGRRRRRERQPPAASCRRRAGWCRPNSGSEPRSSASAVLPARRPSSRAGIERPPARDIVGSVSADSKRLLIDSQSCAPQRFGQRQTHGGCESPKPSGMMLSRAGALGFGAFCGKAPSALGRGGRPRPGSKIGLRVLLPWRRPPLGPIVGPDTCVPTCH
jgi:hypothetical protein